MVSLLGREDSNSTFKCRRPWCLFKKWYRGDGGNPVAIGGPFWASLTSPFLLIISCSAPAPAPRYFPGLAISRDVLVPFPLFWLLLLLQACGRHVTGMSQACSRHGHFHLAACATQVRWRVAQAAPTPCLAGELSGGGAWFPSHSLSLERN